MRTCSSLCFVLAAAFSLASAPAPAQVYSWKDPATGQNRISNIAPRWYSRGEVVNGPRVVATAGAKVIDDTALPFEERQRLWVKPNGQADKARPERPQGQPQQQPPAQAADEQDPD